MKKPVSALLLLCAAGGGLAAAVAPGIANRVYGETTPNNGVVLSVDPARTASDYPNVQVQFNNGGLHSQAVSRDDKSFNPGDNVCVIVRKAPFARTLHIIVKGRCVS